MTKEEVMILVEFIEFIYTLDEHERIIFFATYRETLL